MWDKIKGFLKDFPMENGEVSGMRVGAMLGYGIGLFLLIFFVVVTIVVITLEFHYGRPWTQYSTFAQYTIGSAGLSGGGGGAMQTIKTAINGVFCSPAATPFIKGVGGNQQ